MKFNFTKQNILDALTYLDQHPEEFKGRASVMYDLVHEGKLYPPILVLSKANQLKGGSELTLVDFNRNASQAFKYLTEHGFEVFPKKGKTVNIKEFIEVANTQIIGNGITQVATDFIRANKGSYKNTNIEISYGVGRSTAIPWIAYLDKNQKVKNGVYPVFLYYKENNIMILAYGVSEATVPNLQWNTKKGLQSVKDYFAESLNIKAKNYGDSLVYKVYDAANLPSQEVLDKDLDSVLVEYEELLNNGQKKDNVIAYIKKPAKPFDNNTFIESLTLSNLQFNDTLVKRFVASLVTKPFVILTGLAGSGKTKLAQSFIQWICESDEQYKIVPVGADWINREPLLGYPNGLKSEEYVMPDNGLLTLILNASQGENQQKPYFLLLDEMNLSHVERYFADFLSIMESQDTIKLYDGEERTSTDGQEIPKTISWPKNLFIIGTVNIDETTYMFSPKVLDRANVIEFRLDQEDLDQYLENPKRIDLNALVGQGSSMASSFIELSQVNNIMSNEDLNASLKAFFSELKTVGAEFGYRTAFEIQVLFSQLSKIDATLAVDDKIDYAVMQKLLPKLHGSRSKIVKTLEALLKLCLKDDSTFSLDKLEQVETENIRYKVSFEKLKRMYSNAISNGFTSYAEA